MLDNDTIDVLRSGRAERMRLLGIDCLERRQDFGAKAKQFTSDLAFGRRVTVQIVDRDRYDRVAGEVILPNGESLNPSELIPSSRSNGGNRFLLIFEFVVASAPAPVHPGVLSRWLSASGELIADPISMERMMTWAQRNGKG